MGNVKGRTAILASAIVGLTIGLVGACVWLSRAPQGATSLAIQSRGEEGGQRFVTFELAVPAGKRVFVQKSWLVIDWGTSTQVHGPPQWRHQDPTGKTFEPGTKAVFSIQEPSQRLRRLQLETLEFEAGPRAWRWKLQRLWQTKKLAALRLSPAPKGIVNLQSGLISSYASDSVGSADRSQSTSSKPGRASEAAGSGR